MVAVWHLNGTGVMVADRVASDSAGLNAGGARSGEIAQALAVSATDGAGGQPSHAGVAVADAALAAVRTRQSARADGQGVDMRTAGAVYDYTDGSAAEGLARSM